MAPTSQNIIFRFIKRAHDRTLLEGFWVAEVAAAAAAAAARRRRQCIGENKGLNQIHAADWNPTHNCRQPYNQEKILSLAILINIFF